MTARIEPLRDLADRLTTDDREAYAGLISYFASLPEGDELSRLARLLGLLALLGQRLPDALAKAMAELNEMSHSAIRYHSRMEERLAEFPNQIMSGVHTSAMAKTMAEAFRQQIAGTGLEVTAETLRRSSEEIRTVSGQIAALQPLSTTISRELTSLTTACNQLQCDNAKLIAQERNNAWLWQALLALVLFLGGALFGMILEKRQTEVWIEYVGSRIDHIKIPVDPTTAVPQRRSDRKR